VSPVTFRRALGLGASTTFSRAAAPLVLGLAAASGTLCTRLLWVAGLASLEDDGARVRFGGLLVATAVAWGLQASVLGGALQQAAAALRGQPVPPLLEAIRVAAPRALAWAVLAGAALLAWKGWELLVGGSGLLLFLRGLLHGTGGLAGALGVALAASVGPLGALFLLLVTEMALVRAVVRDEPAAAAGWEAGRSLLARPWAPLGLLALTALLAAAVAGTSAVLAGMGPPRPFRFSGGAAPIRLAITALAFAVAQLVRLSAFAALELGRSGELPAPPEAVAPMAKVPRAELVPEGGQVLEARAVDGPSGTGG
jgi:hypothetical protein